MQEFGVDFWETYVPVVDYDTALAVLGCFTSKGAETHQMDFVTAFLNRDIEDEIFITLRRGYD